MRIGYNFAVTISQRVASLIGFIGQAIIGRSEIG